MEAPSSFPRGWYRIALSDELGGGRTARAWPWSRAVRPLTVRAFGKEVVLFRDGAGRACAVDPHCPHLGAHLGDGRVDAGRLRCPFHGWCFDGDGRCVEIPFARRIPSRAQLASYRVRERDGVLFLWHDVAGGAPDYEVPALPELAEGGWSGPLVFRCRLQSTLYDAKENIVDLAHFPQVHRAWWRQFTGLPEVVHRQLDGAHLTFEIDARMRMLGRDVTSRIRFDLHGPGVDEVRVREPVPLLYRYLTLPIDEKTIEMMQLVYAPSSRVPGLSPLLRKLYQLSFRGDLPGDARIWARKRYASRPVLSEGDGPIPWFRSWWAQLDAPIAAARVMT